MAEITQNIAWNERLKNLRKEARTSNKKFSFCDFIINGLYAVPTNNENFIINPGFDEEREHHLSQIKKDVLLNTFISLSLSQ